ncbi:MAG: AI-2E family transporter [Planctomycetaceae bacterium]|nr:AI-2E family transporter [Planctomycetaceae bacterium]
MQDEGKHGRSPEVQGGAPRGDAASGGDLRTAHLWHFQPVRDLLVIAAVCVAIYAGYAMRTVTVPLLIALALAYLFDPIVTRLATRRRMNRPLAVGVILTALCTVLVAGVALFVPIAVGQTLEFSRSLREGRYDGTIDRIVASVPDEYRDGVRTLVDRIVHPVEEPVAQAPVHDGAEVHRDAEEPQGESKPAEPAPAAATLNAAWTSSPLGAPLVALLGAGADRVWNFALAVLQLGLVAFLIPFYFYYFSVHWPAIKSFFAEMVPDESRAKVFEIAGEMDRAVAGFVRGRIVICTLMGVMFAIGWQVCGVPYGIALGLLTGAFSIVPYLGGIGLPFAVGLLMADQFALEAADRMPLWAMLTWPTVVFIVVQTIEGYVLTPIIAGKATNLDPVTIVVAILAGGSVAGVYGMLLAIPIAACGKIAAKRLLLPRIRAWARGHAADPLPIDAR